MPLPLKTGSLRAEGLQLAMRGGLLRLSATLGDYDHEFMEVSAFDL